MKSFILGIVSSVFIAAVVYFGMPLVKNWGNVDFEQLPDYSVYFDSIANPHKDVTQALDEAKKDNQNVILMVGGDWCLWCRMFSKFVKETPEVSSAMYENYKVVKIYTGKGMNENSKTFLKQLPKVEATPHFFILDKNAKLLVSQNSVVFEQGRGYNPRRVVNFLTKYKDYDISKVDLHREKAVKNEDELKKLKEQKK